ncbi:hypothetical protein ACIREO_16665 [Streptomyces sp. NPDC102441]|uniref:hypothetical protein n=1 Tax=Streptomyces sp. NPDC102441 TaxID=3366176 RepID=UPI003816192D
MRRHAVIALLSLAALLGCARDPSATDAKPAPSKSSADPEAARIAWADKFCEATNPIEYVAHPKPVDGFDKYKKNVLGYMKKRIDIMTDMKRNIAELPVPPHTSLANARNRYVTQLDTNITDLGKLREGTERRVTRQSVEVSDSLSRIYTDSLYDKRIELFGYNAISSEAQRKAPKCHVY